jgi:hypothetical protein
MRLHILLAALLLPSCGGGTATRAGSALATGLRGQGASEEGGTVENQYIPTTDGGSDGMWPKECTDPHLNKYIYCVDENGITDPNTLAPDTPQAGVLQPGFPLTIDVVLQNKIPGGSIRLEATGVPDATVCLDSDAGGPSPNQIGARVAQLHIAALPDTGTFSVSFTRTASCGTNNVLVSRTIPFNLGMQGYHFESGLLFPIVFGGIRRVGTPYVLNTFDRTLTTSESIQAVPVSIALHYFPWGIEGGPQTSAYIRDFCEFQNKVTPSCVLRDLYSWFIRPLALEAGTTISVNPFQEYFLGAAYGPVRGGTLSVGLAFVQGQFIPKNYAEGMLLPSNGTAFVPDTLYMIRPYIGLTFSPEILSTVIDALNAAKKIAPAAP